MKLHELKEKIIENINNSQLEVDAIYYLLKAILSDIADLYNKELDYIESTKKKEDK